MGDHTLAVWTAGLTTGLAVSLLAASYRSGWRAQLRTAGATSAEVAAWLPGDELLPDADLVTTRAIAIDAPPGCVWPWLVQMGSGRAGAYVGDWIGSLLGFDLHSAEVVLPQFQDIELGDEFPYGRGGGVMSVEALEPEQRLAFRLCGGRWISSFALIPYLDTTRLVSRHRIALPRPSTIAGQLSGLLIEFAGAVVERQMLVGIRDRAERLARSREFAASYPVRTDSFVWSGERL